MYIYLIYWNNSNLFIIKILFQLLLKDCEVPQIANAEANKNVVKHNETVLFKCLEGFGTNNKLAFTCKNSVIDTNNAKCKS